MYSLKVGAFFQYISYSWAWSMQSPCYFELLSVSGTALQFVPFNRTATVIFLCRILLVCSPQLAYIAHSGIFSHKIFPLAVPPYFWLNIVFFFSDVHVLLCAFGHFVVKASSFSKFMCWKQAASLIASGIHLHVKSYQYKQKILLAGRKYSSGTSLRDFSVVKFCQWSLACLL